MEHGIQRNAAFQQTSITNLEALNIEHILLVTWYSHMVFTSPTAGFHFFNNYTFMMIHNWNHKSVTAEIKRYQEQQKKHNFPVLLLLSEFVVLFSGLRIGCHSGGCYICSFANLSPPWPYIHTYLILRPNKHPKVRLVHARSHRWNVNKTQRDRVGPRRLE